MRWGAYCDVFWAWLSPHQNSWVALNWTIYNWFLEPKEAPEGFVTRPCGVGSGWLHVSGWLTPKVIFVHCYLLIFTFSLQNQVGCVACICGPSTSWLTFGPFTYVYIWFMSFESPPQKAMYFLCLNNKNSVSSLWAHSSSLWTIWLFFFLRWGQCVKVRCKVKNWGPKSKVT